MINKIKLDFFSKQYKNLTFISSNLNGGDLCFPIQFSNTFLTYRTMTEKSPIFTANGPTWKVNGPSGQVGCEKLFPTSGAAGSAAVPATTTSNFPQSRELSLILKEIK